MELGCAARFCFGKRGQITNENEHQEVLGRARCVRIGWPAWGGILFCVVQQAADSCRSLQYSNFLILRKKIRFSSEAVPFFLSIGSGESFQALLAKVFLFRAWGVLCRRMPERWRGYAAKSFWIDSCRPKHCSMLVILFGIIWCGEK